MKGDLSELKSILASKPNLGYFGTRLHCGVFCLNHHHQRSMIVSIDNRADDFSADTNLPIVGRSELHNEIYELIINDRKTEIHIPEANIHAWINQFK